jgi:opacity protein-like surface antigen
MKKILISAVAVLALSTSAMAGVNSQTGCGLGSMIIKDDSSAVMLALQATTNGTSGNQTFGITSGTSGCSKTKFVMNERAQEFVASNMDILAKEIAVGHGESIDTLAELLEVQDTAAFSASLQSNYNSIYTSKSVEMSDVLDNISTTSL